MTYIQLVKGYGRKQGKHTDDGRRANDVATRVGAKKAAAVPIPDDVAQVLNAPRADTLQARRDAVLMCLLLDHGLRCSEVADLNVEHFDVRSGTFTFYRRKLDLTRDPQHHARHAARSKPTWRRTLLPPGRCCVPAPSTRRSPMRD